MGFENMNQDKKFESALEGEELAKALADDATREESIRKTKQAVEMMTGLSPEEYNSERNRIIAETGTEEVKTPEGMIQDPVEGILTAIKKYSDGDDEASRELRRFAERIVAGDLTMPELDDLSHLMVAFPGFKEGQAVANYRKYLENREKLS